MPDINVICVKQSSGLDIKGAELAPDAIHLAGLNDSLKKLNLSFNSYCTISPNPTSDCKAKLTPNQLKNIEKVNDVNTRLYKAVRNTLNEGKFPLVLGGDHSIAAGSIMAAQKHCGKIGVIWVDAHGDFNNAFSSPSGNIHGMPLSALTGNGPQEILPFMEANPFIDPKNCVIIGARALDEEEAVLIKDAGVTVFSANDICKMGIDRVIKSALDIAKNSTNGIYLTVDIDAVDTKFAPGVSTPEDGGITRSDALKICKQVGASGKLIGAELVELNPLNDINNRTAILAVELITAFLPANT